LVAGDRIAAVGKEKEIPIPQEAERIDAAGNTVMPGLIDGHMHVTSMPGLLDARGHLAQNLKAVGVLRRCLAWGTTTVANVGGCPENVLLRKAIEDRHVDRCSRLLVGAMVNATGGHVRGRSADGPWEVRKAVREMVMAGADFIKTSASGGFQWEHERMEGEDYTVEELKALVEEAHSKGKRVAVHAHSQPGLGHSIEAGCDIIAHGALIDEAALKGIAAQGVYYMPTLFITSDKVIGRPSLPPYMKERMTKAHPIHRAGVRKAHEMGIKICAGTDGGPGDLMYELVELVRCGLSPMDAIVTATRNTAEALGILNDVGTLQPGNKADLLLIQGEPHVDISLLGDEKNILLVMKDGKVEVTGEDWKQYLHPRG
jgi:imidazolonepropionase-like amidohydrolase